VAAGIFKRCELCRRRARKRQLHKSVWRRCCRSWHEQMTAVRPAMSGGSAAAFGDHDGPHRRHRAGCAH
jgi:hypothetical protein